MGIQKNFVVKNGFEVSADVLIVDSNLKRVGIGTTIPKAKLEVSGGFIATNSYISGISTAISLFHVGTGGTSLSVVPSLGRVGINTALPNYPLEVRSSVSTGQTALYVYGDVVVTGDLTLDDINLDTLSANTATITNLSGSTLAYSGISTINNLYGDNVHYSGVGTVANLRGVNLNYTGFGTVTNLDGTNINYTGVSTFTNLGGTNLNYSGIGTFGSISAGSVSIGSTQVIGSDRELRNITSLNVSGISTLGSVLISSGIITATSGVVTYYGDGQYLQNVTRGVGLANTTGIVGYGATILDFRGPGISTITIGSGIGTINITGGGGGGAVSISSIAPGSPSNGDLWYSIEYGRTFVYYDEVTLGIGSTAVWVDAAPFNVNLSQLDDLQVNNLIVTNNTTLNHLKATGISTLANLNVTGITTLTDLIVGNINSSGIVTAVDFNSTSDQNLKYNIETVTDALNIVNSLRGVKFEWKASHQSSYGVIAQELEQVLPDLVSDTDPKTVNYNGIIGVLIEAVKELSSEVEELKKRLA